MLIYVKLGVGASASGRKLFGALHCIVVAIGRRADQIAEALR
jgi:hypothetical protein